MTKFKKAAKKSIKQARKTVKKVYKKAKQTVVKKVNKIKKTTKKVVKTVKKAGTKVINKATSKIKTVGKKANAKIAASKEAAAKAKKEKADRKAAAKEALCKNQEFLESQKKGYSDPTYDYKAGYPRPDEAWAFDANGNIDKEKSAEVSEKIGEWSTYALMLVIPGPEELLIAGFLVKVGGKGGTKLVSKAVTKEVSKLDTPKPHVGIVQSRINLAENPTRFSPSNNAGMKHVRDRHFDPLKNAGQFSISELELKAILQSKKTVNTTVVNLGEGRFERVVDISESIGTVKPSLGGEKTTWLKVITDKAGNVITTFPIPKP
ncbi:MULTISPECIES: hypothetical protein [Listeria]|uniref:hypothetical protein n=1 Tax=Listeria TaxID=1637 RepID=UPI001D01F514|nr:MULTISPECIES: hypothetical protein [Listeria]